MRKALDVLVVSIMLVVGISAVGFAQSPADVIEKIGVIRIESVEVQPIEEKAVHYLNIVTELKNDNDKDIKLAEGEFDFFIQDVKNPDFMVNIGQAACIYNVPPADPLQIPLCQGNKEDILVEAGTSKEVIFSVEMGRGQLSVLETVIHILNFIGKPSPDRFLFIKGRFDLGMKSKKGWTYGEALRVEWMFCPTMQDELPLRECFPESMQ